MTTREKRNDIETTVDGDKIITTPMTTAKIKNVMATKVIIVYSEEGAMHMIEVIPSIKFRRID